MHFFSTNSLSLLELCETFASKSTEFAIPMIVVFVSVLRMEWRNEIKFLADSVMNECIIRNYLWFGWAFISLIISLVLFHY